MAFGLGKNRDSWSSRPLSMILPDNVKLFNKKKNSFIERATQDRRAVEDKETVKNRRKSRQSIYSNQNDSAHSNQSSPVASSRQVSRDHHNAHSTSADPKPVENSHRQVPAAAEDPAPFLTLQSDDNRHSLLGLSREFDASKESLHKSPSPQNDVYSRQPVSAATMVADDSHTSMPEPSLPAGSLHSTSTHSTPDDSTVSATSANLTAQTITQSNTPSDIQSNTQSINQSAPSKQPKASSSEHSRSVSESPAEVCSIRNVTASMRENQPTSSDIGSRVESLNIKDETKPLIPSEKASTAAHAKSQSPEIPSPNASPVLVHDAPSPDPSSAVEDENHENSYDTIELTDMPWAVRARDTPVMLDQQFAPPDLESSTHSQQESTASALSSVTTIDERFVSPNRKVVFNHGVYIFDPADGDELAALTLTEDDLFNPFEL